MHFARARGDVGLGRRPFCCIFSLAGGKRQARMMGSSTQMDDDKFYVPNRLEIEPGAFYFVAKCPITKKILAIQRDPDRGSNPYSHGGAVNGGLVGY